MLAAVDRGQPREEVAETFSVSVPTIKRWLKRRHQTGGIEAIPIPGRPRVKGAALEGWLPGHLERHPDTSRLRSTARRLRRTWGSRSRPPRWAERSPDLPGAGRSKKVPRSLRTRRGDSGALEVAGKPLRRQAVGVRGRVGLAHLHDRPEGEGAERETRVRQGPEEAGAQPDADRLDHPGGCHGRGGLHRGGYGRLSSSRPTTSRGSWRRRSLRERS